MDALAKFKHGRDIGKVVILPSTHAGSPRQMFELYQDAMSIVGKFGKPDLFLTMTCNPEWPEIEENLEYKQTSWDRMEQTCRVFKAKQDDFLNDVLNKKIFGDVVAYVWVIEFQKRGLPHCHLLVILAEEHKLDTAEKIDNCIWAEIPDKQLFPDLYEQVMRHMIHHPCHLSTAKCKPKKNGQCNKNFPKAFQERTVLDIDSFPHYKRSSETAEPFGYRRNQSDPNRAAFKVTNQYVVPYNPYLLLKYRCHLNVEVCSTISAVKYLYKYIYKGWDKALVDVEGYDEISRYVDSRYTSSVEACWRILGFKMHNRFPFVERLPVHTENNHNVTFEETEDLEEVKKRAKRSTTPLLQWFESNKEHPEFSHLTYIEYPQFFRWDKSTKKWIKRMYNKSKGKKNRSSKKGASDEIKSYPDIVDRKSVV